MASSVAPISATADSRVSPGIRRRSIENVHSPGTTLWATPAWIVLTLITGLPTAGWKLVDVPFEGEHALGGLGDGVDRR